MCHISLEIGCKSSVKICFGKIFFGQYLSAKIYFGPNLLAKIVSTKKFSTNIKKTKII